MLSQLYFPFLLLKQANYWKVITYIFEETISVYKHNRHLVSSREWHMYNCTAQQTKHKRKREITH